ncbi:nucleoside diphosphate kinase regulator [Stakelama sediminis]|uniref:Regulator of nucleoside diphosphate kinase n=1 Tax=Stakelama sediminis TaxID=463200 RepID=A0A840Z2M0_9SPHN|nr:regulator of nucleoside diphosphate kinase [Stakelama sediminis]
MTKLTSAERPPIYMIDTEADALSELAISAENRLPQVSELLLEEISRAIIFDADSIPDDVVTMLAIVQFRDEATGASRSAQLVYPCDADISQDRISILTPVGSGLIGLQRGQSILWPDRDGRKRFLTVVSVMRPSPSSVDPVGENLVDSQEGAQRAQTRG